MIGRALNHQKLRFSGSNALGMIFAWAVPSFFLNLGWEVAQLPQPVK
jgi:hypothetical protein